MMTPHAPRFRISTPPDRRPRRAHRLLACLVCACFGAIAALRCSSPAGPQEAELGPTEILIQGYRFFPLHKYIVPGASATWVNADPVPHKLVSGALFPAEDRGRAFESGIIRPGDSLTIRFPRPGRYRYHCGLHTERIKVLSDMPVLFVRSQSQPIPGS